MPLLVSTSRLGGEIQEHSGGDAAIDTAGIIGSAVRYGAVQLVRYSTVGSTNLVLQYGTVSTVRYDRVGRVDTTSSCLTGI